jgi:hypothetical protein
MRKIFAGWSLLANREFYKSSRVIPDWLGMTLNEIRCITRLNCVAKTPNFRVLRLEFYSTRLQTVEIEMVDF